MSYRVHEQGQEYTTEYRAYITKDEKVVSPMHDIPISLNKESRTVYYVNEIPRYSNAKKEINKEEKYNPIKQDIKKGKVRFVHNLFPVKGYLWNYGAIPQTWESTAAQDTRTGCLGDNDPIDGIEIGSRVINTGEVLKVKVLGGIALIDDGECDWKILLIREGDELYDKLNDLQDIEEQMPGLLSETREWFRNYKVAAGGEKNHFALNERYITAEEAFSVVEETHEHWKSLIQETKHSGISLVNTSLTGTPGHSEETQIPAGPPHAPNEVPLEAQEFFFIK
ncbi:nucleosome-remodeling factor 38 kDa subunit [Nematocida sp. LUAm3]|nr:nucleosome-remodeling factor 38 kDa subunit [Nematocida sp. LUAm3]KAI5174557.1 nucleosome-remodeling factor 38 kDa subunit [Nematocida sp. LUAm2]KAI5178037.1 nucleosome-remodeling factor 38 kDa subunit [Nematocida sp. LUAm1]